MTTTDASLRKGRSITNALGQLLRVDEPTAIGGTADADLGSISAPAQPTYYTYDSYGKMVRVQQGVQNRYFKYDSLGRLLRVKQPEQEINTGLNLNDAYNTSGQWTAGFTYDVLGNVLTATDAKGTVITNTYDKASRVTSRTYSNEPSGITTPAVNFYYDGKGLSAPQNPNYAKGKLTKVDNTYSQTRYTLFDNFGRLTQMEQRTPVDGETTSTATPRVSSYVYNLSGALTEETYPSGRVVKNQFEADGDLMNVASKKAGGTVYAPYVSNFLYTASGGISQMRLGNGKWESAQFNNRLQVNQLGLGSSATDTGLWKVNYDYGELAQNGVDVESAKNTGNIARQTLTIPGTSFTQYYKYDSLCRLTQAQEKTGSNQNWIQNWTYDLYGNRSTFTQNIAGNTVAVNPTVDANTNRFVINQGFSYDPNGNIVNDVDPGTGLSRTFTFNGDNKQTEVKRNGVTVGRYFYDGEGKRVKKITNDETTIFVYSAGKLAAEYSTGTPPQNPTISYTTTDHLGSPRVITDTVGQVKSRRDFLPFGEELTINVGGRTSALEYGSADDNVRQKFTGYQKDDETSLDFAEARMYENRFGRFTAVDPLLASGKSANPQTFNRYIYAGNRPVTLTDPKGLDWYWQTISGVTLKRWSTDNKVFDDGTSIDGWTPVNFGTGSDFRYEGCVDAECTERKTAVLFKEGGWDWGDGAAYAWRSFKRDMGSELSNSFNELRREIGGGFPHLKKDISFFMKDPFGEKQLGSPGLSFVTGGLSQELQILKGFRSLSAVTTQTTAETILFEQYSLRAVKDGMYPVFQRGVKEPVGNVFLKQGDVWKYGETLNGRARYPGSFYKNTGAGLDFFPEFKTVSFKDVLSMERHKIVQYEQIFGKLPPGNKIRR